MNAKTKIYIPQLHEAREQRQLNTLYLALIVIGLVAPWVAYPVFLM